MEALSRSVEATKNKQKGGGGRSAARTKDGARSDRGGKSATRSKSAPDATDLSKAELDRLARDLDIRGRSRMNRDQLAQAVAKAS
jgi:DNA end-binding protein Ku